MKIRISRFIIFLDAMMLDSASQFVVDDMHFRSVLDVGDFESTSATHSAQAFGECALTSRYLGGLSKPPLVCVKR